MNSELAKKKLDEAREILKEFELPNAQTNERSAWVFLALANIKPDDLWSDAEAPLLQTFVIMQFISDNYGKTYKPNSRETIRRQTLHQFEQARIVDRNRDNPKRPTNSKDNNYSLNEPVLEIIRNYPDGNWRKQLKEFLVKTPSLKELYSKKRSMDKIEVLLPNGEEIKLSPGKHNQLHADIIHEFCPRFIGKGGVVLYIGDTASSRKEEGGKLLHLEEEYLRKLGVPPMSHDKLPDVVIHDTKNNWLFLIEAVTSHGPVSPKRWNELEEVLADSKPGRVYVTAFLDTKEFRKHAADIAWETEVWISNNPDHMIHFNGDKFLGPRK